MKINKLKINKYGKLVNKEIELNNSINIIYGENESGKSTLLTFITNSLYGISKNKKGRDISDFDKYIPWVGEEFSGRIEYELDNGEEFEVYRDFKKKNPIIYNKNHEDVSKKFNIDKNKGNEFFYEQTKIDEETFLSTSAINQKEIKIEKNMQNSLIQKISNTMSTGRHNVSFKKAIEKINKRQIEEIGSERTRGKPINIIPQEIEEIEFKQRELEKLKAEKENFQKQKEEYEKNSIHKVNINLILREINKFRNNEIIHQEKLKIKNNIINEYENKINNLINEKNKLKIKNNNFENLNNNSKNKKINIKLIFILILFILINIIQFISVKNKLFNYIFSLTSTSVLIFYYFFKNNKNKLEKNRIKNDLNEEKIILNKIKELNNEINIIEKNKNDIKNEIEKNIKENNLKNNLEKQKIKNNYKNKFDDQEIDKLFNTQNIENEIYKIEEDINDDKIKLETLNINIKDIDKKLEGISSLEEQKIMLSNQLVDIKQENRSIEIAKKVLENAYEKIRNNINPEITEKLSYNISKMTQRKYNNILFNEEDGLIVELNDGKYISAERLSIGTIEQIYLSLRFAILDSITKENIPIFLDEAFAFYDTERLKNTLKYISEEFKSRQVIIFTCTNREKECLDKLNLEYNLVVL